MLKPDTVIVMGFKFQENNNFRFWFSFLYLVYPGPLTMTHALAILFDKHIDG